MTFTDQLDSPFTDADEHSQIARECCDQWTALISSVKLGRSATITMHLTAAKSHVTPFNSGMDLLKVTYADV